MKSLRRINRNQNDQEYLFCSTSRTVLGEASKLQYPVLDPFLESHSHRKEQDNEEQHLHDLPS